MTLGERLRKARELKGWSQVYVAKVLDITSQSLSNYERDERDPDTTTLVKLARLYEVSTDYLLGGAPLPPARIRIEIDTENPDIDGLLDEMRQNINKAIAEGYIDEEQGKRYLTATKDQILLFLESHKSK